MLITIIIFFTLQLMLEIKAKVNNDLIYNFISMANFCNIINLIN